MQPRQSGRARIRQANALTVSDHSQGKFKKLLLLLLLLKEMLQCFRVEEFGNVLIKLLSGLQGTQPRLLHRSPPATSDVSVKPGFH